MVELNSVTVGTARVVVVRREDGNGVDLLPILEQAPKCAEFENVPL